MLERWNKN
ncbi:hypothetical protein TIFTF001_050607 [Ficus carica]|uniref:Uncharacterized protein n=1 Tax=Ficus carica TaxID=3494 RepID=A0AA87ZB08_FICCA|nr:hypothetical protein TIFTF001_050607 [Ficus carica]